MEKSYIVNVMDNSVTESKGLTLDRVVEEIREQGAEVVEVTDGAALIRYDGGLKKLYSELGYDKKDVLIEPTRTASYDV